jgi:phosphohistidine phosphatase
MRRLMLLRHAKSDWSEAGQADIDRVLSARGRSAAPRVGEYMAGQALVPDLALVSSAQRTRETWELVSGAYKKPPESTIEPRVYDASADKLLKLIRETKGDIHALLVVGHNPAMEELADSLVTMGDPVSRDAMDEKFPTAALAVIDFPTDSWSEVAQGTGRLDRFVTPRSLRLE